MTFYEEWEIYAGENQYSVMSDFIKTDDILKDMCGIIESSQKAAYQAVNKYSPCSKKFIQFLCIL